MKDVAAGLLGAFIAAVSLKSLSQLLGGRRRVEAEEGRK